MRKFLLSCIFILSIFSCEKSMDIREGIKNSGKYLDSATKNMSMNRTQETDELINSLIKELPKDESFLANYKADKKIFELMGFNDTSQVCPPDSILINELDYFKKNMDYFSENPQYLIDYLNQNGHQGDSLESYFLVKLEAIKKINENWPELKMLNYTEFSEVFINCYNKVYMQEGNGRNCAESYSADIADCNKVFAVTSIFTGLTALAAAIVATPLAAAGAIFNGIGTAYYQDKICRRTAARHYRECMGYE